LKIKTYARFSDHTIPLQILLSGSVATKKIEIEAKQAPSIIIIIENGWEFFTVLDVGFNRNSTRETRYGNTPIAPSAYNRYFEPAFICRIMSSGESLGKTVEPLL